MGQSGVRVYDVNHAYDFSRRRTRHYLSQGPDLLDR